MKKYKFELAGVPHHVDEFFSALAVENDDYNLSLSEIKELYSVGDKIFCHEFVFSEVSLVREDSNPYDSNAVRIDADDKVVGYIKKNEAVTVRQLLDAGGVSGVELEICGGPYKEVVEDEDGRVDVLEKSYGYFATLYIKVGAEKASTPASKAPQKNVASLLIVAIFLFVFGLMILIVAWPVGLIIIAFGLFFLINWIKKRRD